MAYEAPTATEVKARYPAFASVADDTIDAVVVDANRFIDETWFESDYKPAIMALTEHFLVMEGTLDSGGVSSAVAGPITSDKLGDASRSYASRAAQSGFKGLMADLASTAYGNHFLRIRQANVPAVATTG